MYPSIELKFSVPVLELASSFHFQGGRVVISMGSFPLFFYPTFERTRLSTISQEKISTSEELSLTNVCHCTYELPLQVFIEDEADRSISIY